uniref:pentatricopeptide repeat-containing protein 1, mitochondrial n=1 Tax=Doryrhamphus excisus TaxID=161450 RepID=UPI0025ADCF5D|nr:pentatricopeptide repeat-containing protein 1, mitochondrial [Doryrhamphus excisus]
MLPSVAKLCARNGTISVWFASFRSPAVNNGALRCLSSPPAVMFFLPAASREPNVRWVSLSCISRQREDLPSVPVENENFGSFSTDISARKIFKKSSPEMFDLRYREDEDQTPEKPVRKPARRNTTYWYFLQCKKLIKAGKLQEALDMFSTDMLQAERLQPEEYNYSVLIGGCGRAGNLKKAFKLYNDMKKRGLEASDATYTALFNACAESPQKQVGLHQALKLEQELRRKRYPLSTVTYHALLKTHALCNHLQACMHTLREMLQSGHAVTQETFHYLLMGCLKDKDIGFRLALQVWRQMLKSGILPDSNNYTLLLRTARDCGLGDPALASSILLRSHMEECESRVKSSKAPIDVDLLEREMFIQPDLHGIDENDMQNSLVPFRPNEAGLLPSISTPNLLDLLEGKWGGSISIGSVDGPADRLALIGGGEGLLGKMVANGLKPDIRTLTLLADTMAPGVQSLETLLKVAKQHRIKLDTAFYNSAIRRAARTGDLDGAKDVLSVMRKCNVGVDVQTFGSLAMGCQRQKDGLQLLKDMEEAGLRPNVHVFSALIGQASRRLDYIYLTTLLKSMRNMKVWPNEVIVKQLEFAAQYPPNYNQYKSRNNYLVQIDGFRGYYQQWLRAMPAQDERSELHSESQLVANVTTGADALGGLIEAPEEPKRNGE